MYCSNKLTITTHLEGDRNDMRLDALLNPLGISVDKTEQSLEIAGLAIDSSKVDKNYLFAAITGTETDGHLYIEDAIKNGASVVIGEKAISTLPVPYFQVTNVRKTLALLARHYYQYPTKNKILIGITGTNGKTTTSFMLRHILEMNGFRCALFGSVYTIINGVKNPSTHTTLDTLHFHKLISQSEDQVVIMEVSSHGLTQYRVEGIEFDYCIFTNLEHEHLDYHQNMEAYFEAKQSLFHYLKTDGQAIINTNNAWGKRLCKYVSSLGKQVTEVNGPNASYYVQGEQLFIEQDTRKEKYYLTCCMKGKHNTENASLAFTTAHLFGINTHKIAEGLHTFKGVPGRFEMVQHPTGATFVVDYAHTANAFIHLMDTVKTFNPKKIVHIFGFRGNRDLLKRKEMVDISLQNCQTCILTLDDLNNVSSADMVQALTKLNTHNRCLLIPDRTLAIEYAWEQAKYEDWVLITGKGNEPYQQAFTLPSNSDMDTINYLSFNQQ